MDQAGWNLHHCSLFFLLTIYYRAYGRGYIGASCPGCYFFPGLHVLVGKCIFMTLHEHPMGVDTLHENPERPGYVIFLKKLFHKGTAFVSDALSPLSHSSLSRSKSFFHLYSVLAEIPYLSQTMHTVSFVQ